MPITRRALFAGVLAGSARAAGTPVYLILLKGGNALAYYSPDGKLLASVPVGQNPHEMAFSPDRRFLYTVDNGTRRLEEAATGGNSLSVIDVAAKRKIGDISLGEFRRPHGIAVDARTGTLYVTTELPDRLLAVDPARRTVVRTFETKGRTAHMVTLVRGNRWALVSNSQSSNVSAINLANGEVKLIPTGAGPQGGVLGRDGREFYVANREGNNITVIDVEKQQAVANIQTSRGPLRVALAPDGTTLVYACWSERRIAWANAKTRSELDYVLLPGQPVSVGILRDGRFAVASVEALDTVYVISLADRKIVREIRMAAGAAPDPVLEATLA